jgi:23S rRNA (pseudouridine1915-N3)-methyltransferase
MRIQIIAVGQKMPEWIDTGFADYAKRLPRQQSVELTCIPTTNRKMGLPVERLQAQEAEKIRMKLKPGSLIIALDETGRQWTTAQWAQQYQRWLQEYSQVNFIIGGPDGLDPGLRSQAQHVIALGRMTLPHGLARVVLMEQIYRAWSVVEGHPYHRE